MFYSYIDNIMCRCVSDVEMPEILEACKSSIGEGHHADDRTALKILYSRYYWTTIFKDAYEFMKCVINASDKY